MNIRYSSGRVVAFLRMQTSRMSRGRYLEQHCRVAGLKLLKTEIIFNYMRIQFIPRSKHVPSVL